MNQRCPFCLRLLGTCDCPVPNGFARQCRQAPPLWTIVAGFSSHGKTVYLSALTLMLDHLGHLMDRFYLKPLDERTRDVVRNMRRLAKAGEVAEATQPGIPEPLLFQLSNVPLWNANSPSSRTLILYDAAGEMFTEAEQLEELHPAAQIATNVWFLVSLKDFAKSDANFTLYDLVNAYVSLLDNRRKSLRNRRVCIVYTKADDLDKNKMKIPPEVRQYLANDPFKELTSGTPPSHTDFSLQDYLREAEQVSDTLLEWTANSGVVPGGRNFVNWSRDHPEVDLKFCITSALGYEPYPELGNPFEGNIRYRVLDPFFWMLAENSTPRTVNQFRLVLDASPKSEELNNDGTLGKLWESLSEFGDTQTHYLGHVRPIAQRGQRPAEGPPRRKHLRLLGPILDDLASGERVIVVANGPFEDREDFVGDAVEQRVLTVVQQEELDDIWEHVWVMRDGDDTFDIVQHLLNL